MKHITHMHTNKHRQRKCMFGRGYIMLLNAYLANRSEFKVHKAKQCWQGMLEKRTVISCNSIISAELINEPSAKWEAAPNIYGLPSKWINTVTYILTVHLMLPCCNFSLKSPSVFCFCDLKTFRKRVLLCCCEYGITVRRYVLQMSNAVQGQ